MDGYNYFKIAQEFELINTELNGCHRRRSGSGKLLTSQPYIGFLTFGAINGSLISVEVVVSAAGSHGAHNGKCHNLNRLVIRVRWN